MKVSHRRKERELHLLPDVFEVGAAGILTIPAAQAVWANRSDLGAINGSDLWANQIKPQIVPAIELGVVGLALKWIGKKTGLNRVGTKGVRLF